MNVSKKSNFEAFYVIIGIGLFATLYYKEVQVLHKLSSIAPLHGNVGSDQWLIGVIPLALFALEIISHQLVISQRLKNKMLQIIGWIGSHLPPLIILVLLLAKFILESQHLSNEEEVILLGGKYLVVLFIILLGHEVFVHLVPVVKSFSWRKFGHQLFQYTNGCYPTIKVISMCFTIVLLTTLITPFEYITHVYRILR